MSFWDAHYEDRAEFDRDLEIEREHNHEEYVEQEWRRNLAGGPTKQESLDE